MMTSEELCADALAAALTVPGFEFTLAQIINDPEIKQLTRLKAVALLLIGVERGAWKIPRSIQEGSTFNG